MAAERPSFVVDDSPVKQDRMSEMSFPAIGKSWYGVPADCANCTFISKRAIAEAVDLPVNTVEIQLWHGIDEEGRKLFRSVSYDVIDKNVTRDDSNRFDKEASQRLTAAKDGSCKAVVEQMCWRVIEAKEQ